MPFVTSWRSSGSHLSSHRVTGAPFGGNNQQTDTTTDIDLVYSFRTGDKIGESAERSVVKIDPLSESYNPPKGVVEALAYRKAFIERSIAAVRSRPGAPTHFLLGDMGHEFGTAKARFVGSPNEVSYVYRSAGREQVTYIQNMRPQKYFELTNSGVMGSQDPGLFDQFGFFAAKGGPFTTPARSGPTLVAFKAAATSHINEMNPYASKASLLTTLLEFVSGDVPSLLRNLTKHLVTIRRLKASGVVDAGKLLGSEYLNNVFGWTPIIKDIEATVKTLLALDSLLFPSDDTRRRVGRTINTRSGQTMQLVQMQSGSGFTLNTTSSTNPLFLNKIPTGTSSTIYIPNFEVDYAYTEIFSVFTSARFSTGVRPTIMNNSNLDRAIDLLGLKITPEVVWEITPWSWLIDWFSNMGTVVRNLSTLGLSNTILNYAYATGRVQRTYTAHARPIIVPFSSAVGVFATSGTFDYSWTYDHKVRIAASPFGFDVALSSLNASQWAILSALGLARGR